MAKKAKFPPALVVPEPTPLRDFLAKQFPKRAKAKLDPKAAAARKLAKVAKKGVARGRA